MSLSLIPMLSKSGVTMAKTQYAILEVLLKYCGRSPLGVEDVAHPHPKYCC